MIDFDDYFLGADDFFRHGWTRLLKKGTAGLRDGEWLILHLSYTKVQTRLVTAGFFRPQISTDYHRLRAKGYDYDDD